MDLGAMICTPRRPACPRCPIVAHCVAREQGCAEALPVRGVKKPKPVRVGTAYLVVRADGAILLRQRPHKGLLAKMLEVPATGWCQKGAKAENPEAEKRREHEADEHSVPVSSDWQTIGGEVTHTFTHFHLRLTVKKAAVEKNIKILQQADPERCRWVPRDALAQQALPSVMRKVIAHGLGEPI